MVMPTYTFTDKLYLDGTAGFLVRSDRNDSSMKSNNTADPRSPAGRLENFSEDTINALIKRTTNGIASGSIANGSPDALTLNEMKKALGAIIKVAAARPPAPSHAKLQAPTR